MAAVINFLEFKSQSVTPTLVLVGLHQRPGGDVGAHGGVLANCLALLNEAKARQIPIAHVRSINPKGASDRLRYPPWISGFEPARSDMIFDLLQPSCYSNTEFSRAMEYSNGNFAIAGMFGETTCLSTAIDAYHRRHPFAYLADATVCRGNGYVSARGSHDAVSRMMSVYGTVMDGSRWSQNLARREGAR